MDGVGESACVRFFITNSMQFSPLTVHLSVQRATTKSVSTSNFQRPSKPGSGHIVVPVAAATVETDRQTQPSLPRLKADAIIVPAIKSRARVTWSLRDQKNDCHI